MNTNKSISLLDIYEILNPKSWVDLTHAFSPNIPHWAGFPNEERETIYHFDKGVGTLGTGFYTERYSIVGQWGTHVDPPVHFVKGLRTLDQIDVKEMILPLVVIDVHNQVANNPDYKVQLEDISAWEKQHGAIPSGRFVALRTDWSKRWADHEKMQNEDNNKVKHFPGWSLEVLQLLFEQRRIIACGHETTDTNSGMECSQGDYSLETYVLGTNHYQIELLANLDQVPEHGALIVATFPKPKGGSGFPARVFAILP